MSRTPQECVFAVAMANESIELLKALRGNQSTFRRVRHTMKMATWRQLVRATSNRIADEDRRIEHQRQHIAELARDGHDISEAEQSLADLIERSQLLREGQQRLLEGMPGSQRAQRPELAL
jgi:hypothetical protein